VGALAISLIVFAVVFCGALLGMYVRTTLPEGHLRDDVKGSHRDDSGSGTRAADRFGEELLRCQEYPDQTDHFQRYPSRYSA
jgi:hypothetical protein